MFFDQRFGFREFIPISKQPRPVQMDISQMQRHRASFGDLLSFGQIAHSNIVLAEQGVPVRSREKYDGEERYFTGLADLFQ